jgi:Protein of unknown function (DUF2975)
MRPQRTVASLTVVKVALDVAWWLIFLGAGALVLLFGIAAALGVNLRVSVPVFMSLPPGSYRIAARTSGATLHDVTGQLSLSGSKPAIFVSLGVIVVAAGLVLFIVQQLRRLLETVRRGKPFTAANARRVTIVGVAVVVSELLRASVLLVGSWWVAHHVPATGIRFRAGFPLRLEVLAAGVLLIVFAEVFRLGVALQEDHDLTI